VATLRPRDAAPRSASSGVKRLPRSSRRRIVYLVFLSAHLGISYPPLTAPSSCAPQTVSADPQTPLHSYPALSVVAATQPKNLLVPIPTPANRNCLKCVATAFRVWCAWLSAVLWVWAQL
jgi:hypothetical protein